MRVTELWRSPVTSLQGERFEEAELGAPGIAGDRRWALFDAATGFVPGRVAVGDGLVPA